MAFLKRHGVSAVFHFVPLHLSPMGRRFGYRAGDLPLTEDLAENAAIARTDSCAGPGNPILDNLWRERLNLCDRLIGLRPRAPFWRACRLEGLRGAAIGAAKAARKRLGHR